MTVRGIGIDLVPIARMRHILERWQDRFLTRVFTDGALFSAEGKLLLLRRKDGEWELPCGELEFGEEPELCVVRVFNDLGEVHCLLSVTPVIRPGSVILPKGLWRRSTLNGVTGTALVPDTLTDLGGGACFNDARVQVGSLPRA